MLSGRSLERRKALLALTVLAAALPACSLRASSRAEWVTTPSGLQYRWLSRQARRTAESAALKSGQTVVTHYSLALSDGNEIDSSRKRGEPFAFTFGAGQVIRGWEEMVALMTVGDRAEAILPPALAYGEIGYGTLIPPGSTLRFDLEILGAYSAELAQLLRTQFDADKDIGLANARALYRRLSTEGFERIYVAEAPLLGLAKELQERDRHAAAIAVLEWALELFPASQSVAASLAKTRDARAR